MFSVSPTMGSIGKVLSTNGYLWVLRTMQYQATCVDEDCDHYLASPQERDVVKSAKSHTSETDHDVKVTGTYDSPTHGGVYRDGELLDMNRHERREYEQDLRARRQHP